MKEKRDSNLPMKVEEKSLLDKGRDALPNIIDTLKRTGKITGSLALAIVGSTVAGLPSIIGMGGISAVSLFATGGAATLFGIVKFAQHASIKTEPSLMFGSRTVNGEKKIFQDSTQFPTYMRGYDNPEKAALMGLQTLVGFQRYKENLRGSSFEIDENGRKLYSQKISTVTHGINIKNLRALETLGYIKIDSEETEFHKNRISEILGRKPKKMRSLLISEKIGFGNTKDLKKIVEFIRNGDKEGLEGMKKDFTKITFRLTDKPIDFEELYESVQGAERDIRAARKMKEHTKFSGESVETLQDKTTKNQALRRFILIFGGKGILAQKNIGIKYDRFRRPIIDYKPKETFSQKYTRTHPEIQDVSPIAKEKEDFEAGLKKDVDLSKFSRPAAEIEVNNLQNVSERRLGISIEEKD